MKNPNFGFYPRRGGRKRLSICCLLWIGVLALLPLLANARVLEFELKPLWRAELAGVNPVDIDGDGVDELLVSREHKGPRWGVELRTTDNAPLWQHWSGDRVYGLGAVDVDEDGVMEILAREKVGDTAFLLIFSASGKLLERIKVAEGKDLNPPSGWDGNIGFNGMLDVDGDGRNELLLSVASYFDLQPRGFFALDPRTGRRLWYWGMGFAPGSVAIADLDGDGDSELVLGATSTANGSEANGTDDLHTYVTVLDNQGRLVWQRQIGGYFSATRVAVADFDADGLGEIVMVEETERGDYLGPDQLMILDGLTGETKRVIKTGKAHRGLVLCDLDRDDVPEIILGNTDGVVRAFDAALEEAARFENAGEIKVTDAGDLDGDGHPEILAVTLEGSLLVLDDHLQEVKRYRAGDTRSTYARLVNAGRCRRLLLVAAKPNGDVEYIMLDVHRKLVLPVGFPLGIVLPLVVLLLLAIGLVLVSRYRRRLFVRGFVRDPSHGILLLNRGCKIKVMNHAARRFLGLDESAAARGEFAKLHPSPAAKPIQQTILEAIKQGQTKSSVVTVACEGKELRIEVNIRQLRPSGWLVNLGDVTEREFGRRVSTWVPVAQQLAHGIKNPLSHIRLAIQRLEKLILEKKDKKQEASRYLAIVAGEVERLLKLTDGFMRFTKLEPPRRKPLRVEKIIEKLIERIEPTLPKDVEILAEFTPDLPAISVDREQISTALDHLVDNALVAVGKKGRITIRVAFIEKLDAKGNTVPAIEIRVSDTGPGIPQEYRLKVFEPYFSLKKGGSGLGLTMTQRIVEDHKGTITLDSVEGLGATFIMTLPLRGGEE
ncbi:MAG: ATP-binding protein [candidate division WOR-3 bacterium]|nr:ATP-binding protein [candidate division WOR-3 bacterium]